MLRVAICILGFLFGLCGWGFPVVPLVTEPGVPTYLTYVPSLIESAQEEVLVALSDLRLYQEGSTAPLLEALADAAKRGVEVRVLLERRGDDRATPEQLAAFNFLTQNGVETRWDDPEVTLHAKFLVVDRDVLVVGSTHWTYSALVNSVQVDLAIFSPELAALAAEFFELLWAGDLSPQPVLPDPPWPKHGVLPLFELPEAGLHTKVIPVLIARGQKSVDLLLYRFAYYPQYPNSPSNTLVKALIEAVRRGVRVRVLLEGGEDFPDLAQANRLVSTYLILNGVQVRFDAPGSTMHAKCLIVDDRDLLVSSANWSYYSLAKNVEAGVALLDAERLATSVASAFEGLWDSAFPVP